jgi:4-oxalocrotonate tautomerase
MLERLESQAVGLNSRSQSQFEQGDDRMPFVNVRVIEGVFSSAQKQEMIRKLTDTMVSIEGEAMRPVTWVVIEEVKSGDWGIGGKPLTTSDVKALAAAPQR